MVELLVVIAVIAVIAAIAIPNIAGIMGNAKESSARRNAQSVASISSAALAAGASTDQLGTDVGTVVTKLTAGVSVTNNGKVFGPFTVSGLPTDFTGLPTNEIYTNYLQPNASGGVIYKP